MFRNNYQSVAAGDERWQGLKVPQGETYLWEEISTYIKRAPYFDGRAPEPESVQDIAGARVLARLGDSRPTAPISAGGPIKPPSPPAKDRGQPALKTTAFQSY